MAKAGEKGIHVRVIFLLLALIFLSVLLSFQLHIFKFFKVNKVDLPQEHQPALVLQSPEIAKSTTLDQVVLLASSSASTSGDLLVVDNQGVIFKKIDQFTDQLRVIFLDQKFSVGQILPPSLVATVLKMKDKLKDFQISLNTVWAFSKILVVNAPPVIILDLNKNTEIQLAALQLVLQKAKIDNKEIKLIDLRFANPVVKYATKEKQ